MHNRIKVVAEVGRIGLGFPCGIEASMAQLKYMASLIFSRCTLGGVDKSLDDEECFALEKAAGQSETNQA